jgi:tRNA threonylcarbamoyladenosine biosynthesis protein TsaE
VLHFDLYRLAGGEELELLGYRDLRAGSLLALVEWPERAAEALGPVDLACTLSYDGAGRRARLAATTPRGQAWLAAVAARVGAAGTDSVKMRPG